MASSGRDGQRRKDRGIQRRRPAVDPLQAAVSAALPAAELLHEHRSAVSDQPCTDVAPALIDIRAVCRFPGKGKDPLGHSILGLSGSAGQLLDDSPIAVPRFEIHPGIDPGRVSAKNLLHAARMLEDLAPVEQGKLPEAGESVADGDLVLRLAVLLAEVDLPEGPAVRALEPPLHQHECRLLVVEVVDELTGEVGTRGGLAHGKLGKDGKELVGATPVGPDQPVCPEVCDLPLAELGGSAQGDVPDALDQGDAQHLGEGPELRDRQGTGRLAGIHEPADVLPVQALFQLEDEPGGYIVDSWQADGRSARQGWKPPAELGREIHLDVTGVALDDVFVVENPLRGGRCSLLQPGRLGEIRADLMDLATRVQEPRDHGALPAPRG